MHPAIYEHLPFFAGLLIFINWAIATIIFRKISVDYLDKKLGLETDNSGRRIMSWAVDIVAEDIKQRRGSTNYLPIHHLRPKDIKLAWYFQISSLLFFVLAFLTFYFGE
ncbi:hypothetical protein SNR37_003161 [Agarivorans aestuarii]|uniref:Uncharacterized protein n=1 Tax=Agarivorans aestuarii TaxID=1563703 RepID=A0ABU7G3H7_9ALTE|nr:hypothetical protein [Agarivorans aestuarii]MEE1673734.1 hypothetical protein [Agarivorans aestuarii]